MRLDKFLTILIIIITALFFMFLLYISINQLLTPVDCPRPKSIKCTGDFRKDACFCDRGYEKLRDNCYKYEDIDKWNKCLEMSRNEYYKTNY